MEWKYRCVCYIKEKWLIRDWSGNLKSKKIICLRLEWKNKDLKLHYE